MDMVSEKNDWKKLNNKQSLTKLVNTKNNEQEFGIRLRNMY